MSLLRVIITFDGERCDDLDSGDVSKKINDALTDSLKTLKGYISTSVELVDVFTGE
jgi:hypothetical protein